MATVPIEIILQDAEVPVDPTPTPTPESGEETNIVVPNTGTISNDGSNNGEIGSTVSIILPIVIVALALGAMVALLVRRQQKRKNNINANMSKKEKFATVASGTIAILAATVLVGNLVIPATNAATSVEPGTAELDTVDKITITATREIDSDITVATVKNTSYATANLDFGYKVIASMAEGATTANLYLDGDETSEYYIAPVTDGTLTDNTWGYTLSEDAEEYLSMALADSPAIIVKGNDAVENESVDIYYTIKADKSLPAGTYMGALEYDLVELGPIESLTYLQDLAKLSVEKKATILNSMIEDEQYYLKDNRDDKVYRIAKLRDGNVWMTQNLDLQKEDLLPGVIIDSSNTDNPAPGFMIPDSQIDGNDSWGASGDEVAIDAAHVYDIVEGEEPYHSKGKCIRYDHYGNCEEYEDLGVIPTEEFGNYYNWYSATAGTGTFSSTNMQRAGGSVCPSGWRLPVGGNERYDANDYTSLLYIYGIINRESGGASSGSFYSDTIIEAHKSPIYLQYMGAYDDGARYIGRDGEYWYASSLSNDESLDLSLDARSMYPWSEAYKFRGYSIRCILR